MSDKICRFIAGAVVCLLILAAGCKPSAKKTVVTKDEPPKITETKVEPKKVVEVKVEPKKVVEPKVEPKEVVEVKIEPKEVVEPKVEPKGPAVKLALKYKADDVATYKVTTEAQKSVMWEGPLPSKPSAFKGGSTSNKIEITFTQRIKSVDDKGNAAVEITIKQLKYKASVRDNVVMDFDNSREKDRGNPLAKLIGQSYGIEVTPSGRVSKVTDITAARAAVKGATPAHKTAQTLVSADVVKQRHTVPALPADGKKQSKGDNWTSLRTFNFGMMGSKSYERVYELGEVKGSGDEKVAIVQMKAVPSTENAAELHKEQATGFLSKLFDNTEEYTGTLKLDLGTGKIRSYTEKLKSEWLAVDPESLQKDDKEPAALRMTALRSYQIEKID